MDVMDLRRMLMMVGGSAMVGDFSKYEKKTLTFPNSEDSSDWDKVANVPCSFDPKLIIFYGGDATRNGTVLYGIFALDTDAESIRLGAIKYINSGGTNTQVAYTYNTSPAGGRFKYENGIFYASRPTLGAYWNPNDHYTFEIYG